MTRFFVYVVVNEHRNHEITSSDEILLGRDSNTNSNKKRLTGPKDNASQDVSTAIVSFFLVEFDRS